MPSAANATEEEGDEEEEKPPEWLRNVRIVPPGHTEPLRFNALLSAQGDVGARDANGATPGLRATDSRLSVAGRLEGGFGYFVNTELTQDRPLLDLVLDARVDATGTTFQTGLFRAPFSGEFLIGAPHLDFLERSQAVRAIAPGRQIGVQVDQRLVDDALVLRAGVFGGEGRTGESDDRFLYVLRFDGESACGEEDRVVVRYGVNGAYTNDDDYSTLSPAFGLDDPDVWLAGGDVRVQSGSLFVSSEGLYASIDSDDVSRREIHGYQLSVGWHWTPSFQTLLRYDALYGDGPVDDRDLAIVSAMVDFNRYVNLQGELRVPTRSEDATPGGAASFTIQF